jgi:6,7-dimethyl-8-ribityllumazine synthase
MFTIPNKKPLTESQQKNFRVAIVYSNWHSDIVEQLLKGSMKACLEKGLSEEHIHLYSVPGAYEIPQMVEKIAHTKKHQAIVTLGCVVRGETGHYDLICNTISASLDQIARHYQVAVSFGVLTVEDLNQALDRAGGMKGNKGEEAANAAIDLASELERV